jgi:nucleoside-diphosphate-sugar epimerase
MGEKRRVLVIGGNRYFGRRLVAHLLERGDDVTLLNRGQLDDGFGARVRRIKLDRALLQPGHPLLGDQQWDLVYDQVCYDSVTARATCETLNGRVGRIIVISSQSVYGPQDQAIDERVFNPRTYKFTNLVEKEKDYGEAKRQMEATYFTYSDSPVIAVRFPIVLGEDDYTGRLKFHVDAVAEGKPLYFPDLAARISFLSSADAGKFLAWLSDQSLDGPINVCSSEPITLRALISQIETAVGQKAWVAATPASGEASPFGLEGDWYMSTERLEACGFRAQPLSAWLFPLIEQLAKKRGASKP